MSERRLDDEELRAALADMLQQMPAARVLVATIELEAEGPPMREKCMFLASDNFEHLGDSVCVADQLLRHASQLLAGRTDEWAIERLGKLEAARAVLAVEMALAAGTSEERLQ